MKKDSLPVSFSFPAMDLILTMDKKQQDKTHFRYGICCLGLRYFDSVANARKGISDIRLSERYKGAGTVHYRIADKSALRLLLKLSTGK